MVYSQFAIFSIVLYSIMFDTAYRISYNKRCGVYKLIIKSCF